LTSERDESDPGTVRSDDPTVGSNPAKPARFRPGFAWGLAFGSLAVVLIVVLGMAAVQIIALRSLPTSGDGDGPSEVVVSPTKAGKQWFTVGPNGTGRLQGWASGDSGSGETPERGVVAYFSVGTVDLADGIRIAHTTNVYLTRKTEITIGGQVYKKGKARSPAEAIFGDDVGRSSEVLSDRLLTIRFHRAGTALVADSISAPLEATTNPLQP